MIENCISIIFCKDRDSFRIFALSNAIISNEKTDSLFHQDFSPPMAYQTELFVQPIGQAILSRQQGGMPYLRRPFPKVFALRIRQGDGQPFVPQVLVVGKTPFALALFERENGLLHRTTESAAFCA
jgi:hypothetical protein